MCREGTRTRRPDTVDLGDSRIESNDAERDWIRFGGAKGMRAVGSDDDDLLVVWRYMTGGSREESGVGEIYEGIAYISSMFACLGASFESNALATRLETSEGSLCVMATRTLLELDAYIWPI